MATKKKTAKKKSEKHVNITVNVGPRQHEIIDNMAKAEGMSINDLATLLLIYSLPLKEQLKYLKI